MSKLTIELIGEKNTDDKNAPKPPFEKMQNCPFCDSDYLTIKIQDDLTWGHCRACGCDGPVRSERHNAIGVWNRRKKVK